MDVQEQIAKGTARMAELDAAIADAEKQANALEQQARDLRRQRHEWKIERESLSKQLAHNQVIDATNKAAQAAQQSQENAKANENKAAETLARLVEKEKQLDELLLKAAETK